MLPEFGQQLDRVKNTAEIGQWGQHEGRHDTDIVETVGKNSVDQSGHGEQAGCQQRNQQDDRRAVNAKLGEQ